MVTLCLKLLFRRNDEWVDAGLQQYEAATLDGLCLRIRETFLKFGWITPSDGVNVDSYYGVATDDWRTVLSFGDIPTPQALLRITQRVEAAEPPRTEQKRGSEEVDDAAEQTAAKRMCGSKGVARGLLAHLLRLATRRLMAQLERLARRVNRSRSPHARTVAGGTGARSAADRRSVCTVARGTGARSAAARRSVCTVAGGTSARSARVLSLVATL
jgi:hypothetical protein